MRFTVVVPICEYESAKWRLTAHLAHGVQHHAFRLKRPHVGNAAEIHDEELSTRATNANADGAFMLFNRYD
ncbi:hypothetical protein D3C83_128420 [compost metagenome]